MIGSFENHRNQQVTVSIEELVEPNHFLRTVEQMIDFSFIDQIATPYYCQNNGRPSIPPITLFKMLFIGYFYGIPSERKLEQEIKHNVAYRWFLGLSFQDKVPDHSTISFNRKKRFQDSTVFEDIFDEIVCQAKEHRMVDGRILIADSTHVKANANKNKFIRTAKKKSVPVYIDQLEQAVQQDREAHGKKHLGPLKENKEPKPGQKPKTTRISKTDPDSGFLMRSQKPQGFFYLDHRTVDAKYNIITDTWITAGNVSDATPYLERLKVQKEKFQFPVEAVALDAGFFTGYICKTLHDENIFAVMGYRRTGGGNKKMPKRKFRYIPERECFVCPMGCILDYANTDRNGYQQFKSRPEDCAGCPHRPDCFSENTKQRTVTRHLWEPYKEKVRQNKKSPEGKTVYSLRSQTIERSFADSKERHSFRYARCRGRSSVQEQAYLTAACQNMKKIALHLKKKERSLENQAA
jgi:transposase